MQDYIRPAGSDGCSVMAVAVLTVVGGGSSPSPAASDGWPLVLLLLAVVLVAVLAVVGRGSSPSPAASEG
ncbi:hypothetical protein NDU88_008768 [Pleurodeles waltl]|uniref:Uncharacterized protein n=1 Tax=Pleurodeles waltl TaxID=8319 RepID=A0AAV7PXL1_PLEWA|nr:hypothetical protein NDU88_008768 [Pleurodeles waltl]